MPMSHLGTAAVGTQYSARPHRITTRDLSHRAFPRLDLHEVKNAPLLTKDGVEIWLADSNSGEEVDKLVSRMYRQRGYLIPQARMRSGRSAIRRVTLEARHEGTTVGTLSVNLGGSAGLNAEELYADEIAPYRRRGGTVCEFTRLALDSENCSKQALACLFHLGLVFAIHIYRASDLFIEVNPRHALFYRRKLNFRPAGREKICPRVDAPAVLLHKDLEVCSHEIGCFGGFRAPENRTFYAFMLTPGEEGAAVATVRNLLTPDS